MCTPDPAFHYIKANPNIPIVQYHDREKIKDANDKATIEERRERLEALKREEGIE